ncbi:hypothetical protein CAOG_000004 [Capsaspora owczarzaki ATCC 30864]|uniref:SWIM-type domain-containing protein n=2 Tax=Capsaspora owczarzaki (strain ATCC 30864) TaxID=595528 RepID=A0A0D2WG62_CAPO3|nr:hypothetical protein CAOG_000004 [Capsaspora owczarzaki ATCC 30864]
MSTFSASCDAVDAKSHPPDESAGLSGPSSERVGGRSSAAQPPFVARPASSSRRVESSSTPLAGGAAVAALSALSQQQPPALQSQRSVLVVGASQPSEAANQPNPQSQSQSHSQSAAAAAAAAAVPLQTLVFLCGPPCSGKSFYMLNSPELISHVRLSRRDHFRCNPRAGLRTFAIAMRQLLVAGHNVLIDDDNGSLETRQELIEQARTAVPTIEVHCIVFRPRGAQLQCRWAREWARAELTLYTPAEIIKAHQLHLLQAGLQPVTPAASSGSYSSGRARAGRAPIVYPLITPAPQRAMPEKEFLAELHRWRNICFQHNAAVDAGPSTSGSLPAGRAPLTRRQTTASFVPTAEAYTRPVADRNQTPASINVVHELVVPLTCNTELGPFDIPCLVIEFERARIFSATKRRWELKPELVQALQGWSAAQERNRTCGRIVFTASYQDRPPTLPNRARPDDPATVTEMDMTALLPDELGDAKPRASKSNDGDDPDVQIMPQTAEESLATMHVMAAIVSALQPLTKSRANSASSALSVPVYLLLVTSENAGSTFFPTLGSAGGNPSGSAALLQTTASPTGHIAWLQRRHRFNLMDAASLYVCSNAGLAAAARDACVRRVDMDVILAEPERITAVRSLPTQLDFLETCDFGAVVSPASLQRQLAMLELRDAGDVPRWPEVSTADEQDEVPLAEAYLPTQPGRPRHRARAVELKLEGQDALAPHATVMCDLGTEGFVHCMLPFSAARVEQFRADLRQRHLPLRAKRLQLREAAVSSGSFASSSQPNHALSRSSSIAPSASQLFPAGAEGQTISYEGDSLKHHVPQERGEPPLQQQLVSTAAGTQLPEAVPSSLPDVTDRVEFLQQTSAASWQRQPSRPQLTASQIRLQQQSQPSKFGLKRNTSVSAAAIDVSHLTGPAFDPPLDLEEIESYAFPKVFSNGSRMHETDMLDSSHFPRPRIRNTPSGHVEIFDECRGEQEQHYHVAVQLNRSGISASQCQCAFKLKLADSPSERMTGCKHIVALLLRYLYAHEDFEFCRHGDGAAGTDLAPAPAQLPSGATPPATASPALNASNAFAVSAAASAAASAVASAAASSTAAGISAPPLATRVFSIAASSSSIQVDHEVTLGVRAVSPSLSSQRPVMPQPPLQPVAATSLQPPQASQQPVVTPHSFLQQQTAVSVPGSQPQPSRANSATRRATRLLTPQSLLQTCQLLLKQCDLMHEAVEDITAMSILEKAGAASAPTPRAKPPAKTIESYMVTSASKAPNRASPSLQSEPATRVEDTAVAPRPRRRPAEVATTKVPSKRQRMEQPEQDQAREAAQQDIPQAAVAAAPATATALPKPHAASQQQQQHPSVPTVPAPASIAAPKLHAYLADLF